MGEVAGSPFVDDVFKNLTLLRFGFFLPWLMFSAMQLAMFTVVGRPPEPDMAAEATFVGLG